MRKKRALQSECADVEEDSTEEEVNVMMRKKGVLKSESADEKRRTLVQNKMPIPKISIKIVFNNNFFLIIRKLNNRHIVGTK